MRRSLHSLLHAPKNSPSSILPNRRHFLLGATAATLAAASHTRLFAAAFAPLPGHPEGILKIQSVELLELHGRYTDEAGVNHQQQVNPLDVYDDLRPTPYTDKPSGSKEFQTSAIYLRIRTAGGIDGLYGPLEKSAATVVEEEIKPFLMGKDALAGEALWDQMYRSNRHSRDGFFMMAISAVDNTLWDIRGKYYNVPVYRLLGGPTRSSVEMYASCLGFSLEPEAVRTRALANKAAGFRYQKWFMGYGPGSGPEGMAKNVELVRILRETLGDDTELMFDAYSGWDQDYALDWAHRVEKYRPHWMEEVTHPEKIEAFAFIRRSTTIPIASGEHFYGRWEVERYLQAGALSVVQADPEWCGGISELLRIGTVASLHDVPVIPHGHSLHAALHAISSQSPMTFPLGEYLILKMRHYYHFEAHPLLLEKAHITLPTGPGFNIQLDPAKIESQTILKST
ncbi:enolase C-terminal domain-like protein [Granulicella sp. L60]|uniref:enolase C-terminal domain-like protein n=1 Tax=Granulicella sp. L60 TaxID=1641866 RepID=UPI00131DDE76|nr:enolase C-terminal domain-like protein [Granulicella sp. L60]